MARKTGGDRSGGMRKQCQKVLPSNVKPEMQHLAVAKCKMFLLADGTCPEHGRDIG